MDTFFIQAIGFVGVVAFIISYQVKSNKALYFFQLLGSLLFCIQFFLLDAGSGAMSLGLNIMRSALLIKHKDWKWVRWKGLPFIFCMLFAFIMFYTWAGPISLLAFVASAVSTIFYWTNNAKLIRMSNLFCASPAWFVYDILVKSWGGVLNETITLLSIILSVVRFGWKELGDPESSFN